jgi:DNA polymerase (family 10)
MNNAQIADAFEQMAKLLELKGEKPFRIRAYENGARTVSELDESVASYLAAGKDLTDLPGIGDTLAEKITVMVQTGRLPQLEALQAEFPPVANSLLRIPGLGPKRAGLLLKELKIQSLDELKLACEEGRVSALKGFGKKIEQAVLKGLEFASQEEARMLWFQADEVAAELRTHLEGTKTLDRLEFAGSYRRGRETVGDLDVLAQSKDPNAIMDRLGEFPGIAEVLGRGDTKMSIRILGGPQVDLRVLPAESFGAALQYFTGSQQHNIVLRRLAQQQGLKINEYGVFRNDDRIAGETEEDVYAAVGLPWIPPELREARQEFEWAEANQLPKLIELKDLVGDLHMHTTESDGTASLEEMVEAAQALGHKYIAITDHSKRVTMANGLDGARLRKQWKQIDELNKQLGKKFTVLKGVEVDILEAGGLDIPDDVLAEADWVVASLHYGQRQPREQITERMLGALENKYVSAIGHPTGRLLSSRPPYDVDTEALINAARENGKALELNANPERLDLNDILCASARRAGVPIVISSDAHSPHGLQVLKYGIIQARRAGLTAKDVLNTRTWNQVNKLIKRG